MCSKRAIFGILTLVVFGNAYSDVPSSDDFCNKDVGVCVDAVRIDNQYSVSVVRLDSNLTWQYYTGYISPKNILGELSSKSNSTHALIPFSEFIKGKQILFVGVDQAGEYKHIIRKTLSVSENAISDKAIYITLGAVIGLVASLMGTVFNGFVSYLSGIFVTRRIVNNKLLDSSRFLLEYWDSVNKNILIEKYGGLFEFYVERTDMLSKKQISTIRTVEKIYSRWINNQITSKDLSFIKNIVENY